MHPAVTALLPAALWIPTRLRTLLRYVVNTFIRTPKTDKPTDRQIHIVPKLESSVQATVKIC